MVFLAVPFKLQCIYPPCHSQVIPLLSFCSHSIRGNGPNARVLLDLCDSGAYGLPAGRRLPPLPPLLPQLTPFSLLPLPSATLIPWQWPASGLTASAVAGRRSDGSGVGALVLLHTPTSLLPPFAPYGAGQAVPCLLNLGSMRDGAGPAVRRHQRWRR